jgi:hypothetical protein
MSFDEATMREYAQLADGAYGRKGVDGWELDTDLSNSNRAVYHKDGKAVVSFRGTDLSGSKNRWKDLGTDVLLALGLESMSTRFQNAKKTTDAALTKYGEGNVSLTGHSLGGSQALYVHQKTGLDTHAFNPGVSPLDVFRSGGQMDESFVLSGFPKKTMGRNARAYITRTDLIGGLAPLTKGLKTIVIGQKTRSPHSIKNFI